MSACRPEDLEERLAAQDPATLLHVAHCARCGREKAWLDAERSLFAQRQSRRGASEAMWDQIAARSVSRPAARSGEGWRRGALAMAASLLLIATFSARDERAAPVSLPVEEISSAGSFTSEEGISHLEQDYGACLEANPLSPHACGPAERVPATFAFSQP